MGKIHCPTTDTSCRLCVRWYMFGESATLPLPTSYCGSQQLSPHLALTWIRYPVALHLQVALRPWLPCFSTPTMSSSMRFPALGCSICHKVLLR